MSKPLFEVKSLVKHFPVETGILDRLISAKNEVVHAVDGIDFEINRKEIFCLVGESGCGKTTTARVISGLEEPTAGQFIWKEKSISHSELKPKKEDVKTQFVFQDPYSSLNPRMRAGEAVQHPLVIQDRIAQNDIQERLRKSNLAEIYLVFSFVVFVALYVISFILPNILGAIAIVSGLLLFGTGLYGFYKYTRVEKNMIKDPEVLDLFEKVGLSPAEQYYDKYPHELSGGERQRVNIARSIILNPELLILDEPTSMLDVSLRAGILDLLKKIQEEFDISILFITHDLATARHFSDRIAIMYVGEIVELGETDDLFKNPKHPYTRALIDAIPSPSFRKERVELPVGEVPDAISPPPACRFHPRCPIAKEKCSLQKPEFREISKDRWVACHFPLID